MWLSSWTFVRTLYNCRSYSYKTMLDWRGEKVIPYIRKIWRWLKFGGLAVRATTAKLKFANISVLCIYVWRYRAKFKFSFWRIWTKPPNLNTANISGYTVRVCVSQLYVNSLLHRCLLGNVCEWHAACTVLHSKRANFFNSHFLWSKHL